MEAAKTSRQSQVIDVASHTFIVPYKQLTSPNEIPKWEKSQAYSNLVGFILTLNEAVKNKKIRDEYPVSEVVQNLLDLLGTLEKWVEEIPAIDQPQRFGNKAFRTWFQKLKEEGPALLKTALPDEYEKSIPEIVVYLVESVGNDTRIDYGTGHELSFVAFLCCLCQIGALKEEDHPALVLRVFERYLYLMRKLQLTYRMEPAGSHGVWSLDDYQFLPFLWGSSQFIDHKRIKPKSFPEPDIYDSFYKDYLFLSAIKFINQVKTGPFAEHSNQLWGISGVAAWSKVNSGLIKMYRVEVLSKFPIIQHFLFGSLLTLEPSTDPVPAVSAPMPSPAPGAMPGRMPPLGATDMMPPTGRMPPSGMTGMMPPMGRMPPPGVTGTMPPTGRMPPPGVTGTMPPTGRMPPPGAAGVMPPTGKMSPSSQSQQRPPSS